MNTEKLTTEEIHQIIIQIAEKPKQAFKIIAVLIMNGNIPMTPWDLASDKIVKDSDLGPNFKHIKDPSTVCYDF
ncbi:MAG: hypothetical protein QME64_11625, partial [bacterium]|nr:hypothetical protein [bacterium]